MGRYQVNLVRGMSKNVEIEAETEEDAIQQARQVARDLDWDVIPYDTTVVVRATEIRREPHEESPDGWRLELHAVIENALVHLSPDEVRDTVEFALVEHMRAESS